MTVLEQRFMTLVPDMLGSISKSLASIDKKMSEKPEKVMVLYEVDEIDNTKTSIVAMTETDWEKRKPEAIEKVLREYFDERYADCDDDYFCYEDEIKQAVEALSTGYETEFSGDTLFWDSVEMI